MATRDETLRFLIKAEGAEELKDLAKEVEKLAKSGDAAEGDLTAFVEELDKLAQIDRSITALTKLKVALAETGTNLDRARVRVDELEKEFAQAEKPTARLSKQLDAARDAVDQLSRQQNRQTAELARNSSALAKAGVDTERLGGAQRQVRQDITNLSDRFTRYSAQLRDAGPAAERAAKGTRDLGSAAKSTSGELAGIEVGLGKVAAAAGVAIAALQSIRFGAGLLTDATALQGQLAEVQAIASAGAEEFAQLRAAAESAAADTGIAIDQVTSGLGELARAGFETKDTIAALRPSLDLAQAGSLSLSEAVGITTTTLTQFREGADQAGRVADVLASAANSTQSSVEELGRALTDVAPLARQLDISFEETVAILGRLADEGFRGSRAGTALRSAFAQLLDPSSSFRAELAELGITSTDFTTVLEELATKGDAGRNALLALGQEAAPAILALAGKGGGAIRALTADLQNAEGSANQVAQAIRDTLGNAFNRLRETAGNAIRQLIDPLLKPLQGLLEDVAARLRAFASSKDFARIRDGLALAFENGVETIREFLNAADFSDIAADVQTFAAEAGRSFSDLRENVAALVRGFDAAGSAVRIFGNAIQVAVSAAESNLLTLERRFLSAQQTVLELSNTFGLVDEELAGIEARIGEIDRRQAQLRSNGERDWSQLKDAAADFGAAVSGADDELKGLASNTSPINALVGGIKSLAAEFGLIPPAVKQAAEEIELLPEVLAGTAEQINAAQKGLEGLGENAKTSGEILKQSAETGGAALKQLGEEAKEAAKGVEAVNEEAAAGGGFAGVYAQALARLREEFQGTSQAAVDLFLGYQKLAARGGAGSDLLGLLDALQRAGEQTRRELAASRLSADVLASGLAEVAQATDTAALRATEFGARFGGSTAASREELARLLADIAAVENGTANAASGLQFLDKATLSNLRSSAEAAAQSIQRIEDAALAARRQLDELERRLQDDADRAAGNEEAIRRRQFEDELRQIDALAEAGGASAQAQAQRLRRLSEEAFERELQQIRARERAQIDSDDRVRQNRERGSSSQGSAGSGGISRQSPVQDAPGRVINFNFSGPTLGTPEDLARELQRQFARLDRIGYNPRQ